MSNLENLQLYTRAVVALFRSDPRPDQPSEALSDVEEHDGLRYVVLRNGHRVIACYRLRHDGKLKRIKSRLPAALAAENRSTSNGLAA